MADDDDLVQRAEESIDFVKEMTSKPKPAARPKPAPSREETDAEADAGIGFVQEVTKPDPHVPGAVEHTVAAGGGSQGDLSEARGVDADLKGDPKGGPGCLSPLTLAALGTAVIIAVIVVLLNQGGDDSPKCTAMGTGEVAALAQDECADDEGSPDDGSTDTGGDGSVDTVTPGATAPPGEPVRYAGSSGGQLGCIACDGQSRFISIERSDVALGDANRAGQEMVWPQDGQVTDFGVDIGQANIGRYGINLFVNGEYSVGCAIETGQDGCTMQMEPGQLKQGDRVTIIVGEQGTVDERGVPTEVGDFVLQWYFVFEAA